MHTRTNLGRFLAPVALFACLSWQARSAPGACVTPSGPAAAGLATVNVGPVTVDEALLATGAPVPLEIADCDADGAFDVWIGWSWTTAAPPATFHFGRVCLGKGARSVRITFVGNSGMTTWRAYDSAGALLDTQSRLAGLQVVALSGFGSYIDYVTLEGQEVCVKQICWSCIAQPNGNGLLLRGDFNGDATPDISDAIANLGYLFLGKEAPGCMDAADANDDGRLDTSDAIFTLSFLFLGGAAVPAPHPKCGRDPTSDALVGTSYDLARCP